MLIPIVYLGMFYNFLFQMQLNYCELLNSSYTVIIDAKQEFEILSKLNLLSRAPPDLPNFDLLESVRGAAAGEPSNTRPTPGIVQQAAIIGNPGEDGCITGPHLQPSLGASGLVLSRLRKGPSTQNLTGAHL